jgi:hypothetical protein
MGRRAIPRRRACFALMAAIALALQAGCGDGGGDESAGPDGYVLPPAPAVSAVREADSVIVQFRFPEEQDGEPEPWLLLTSVNSAGTRVPPLTIRTPVAGRQAGEVRQPLGAGRPPFKLLVATLARTGLRSPFVEIPLTK